MHTIDTHALELTEGRFEGDETVRFRADFALHGGNGARSSSVVVIELEPGGALGEHTDSPEEILLVTHGEVGLTVGNMSTRASPGHIAVVPPKVPHSIRNLGGTTARIVGFFPSPTVVSAFIEPIQPLGEAILILGGTAAQAKIA